MKVFEISIIITAEYQEKFIDRAIKSCLNQTFQDFEIIVCFKNLNNLSQLKKKYQTKKIVFNKVNKIFFSKTQDQLYKIKKSLNICRGKNIFLLDGDDVFSRKKLQTILPHLKIKNYLILDNYITVANKRFIKQKKNIFKENIFYKKIINSWPKNICTSCVAIKKSNLKKFFMEINFLKYEYLAIDILLVIFHSTKSRYLKVNNYLTFKHEIKNSVDKKFIGLLNKFFWKRRMEQHKFYKSQAKNYINLDYLITRFIVLLIN